jgi:hypothetical protein
MSQFSELVSKLLASLREQSSPLASDVRQAILKRAAADGGAVLEGGAVPEELERLVDKIARHAYRVTDEDYAQLREAGYSEDQLFALTLSAATGAAWARLARGLAVLHEEPAAFERAPAKSGRPTRESGIRGPETEEKGKVDATRSR